MPGRGRSYPVQVMAVQMVLCALLVVLGAALVFIGWRGLRSQLPPNRYVGVRTPATLRSEEAFELGNRVAAPAMLAGGAVAILAGASEPLLSTTTSAVVVAVLGIAGAFALMVVGGVLGNRAAEAIPAPVAAGCGGCPGGCCG